MKNPFKNPMAPKARKVSREFAAPTKDQATTGSFMRPGDSYGVGFKTPVGKVKAASKGENPILQESMTIEVDEMFRG